MTTDESNLNTLSTFHYVVGILSVFFACFPLIHMFIGLAVILNDGSLFGEIEEPPPELFGWLFFGMGLLFFLMGQFVSISVIVSGRFIRRRKHYLFSFIVGCILCAFFPFGTVLGVFTIILLSKEKVKGLYGQTPI